MSDFIAKLSSYNFLNYLLTGVIFVVLATYFTSFNFAPKDLILGVFVLYFIGILVSRVGSLFLEPLLKKMRFVKFAPYRDFVSASSKDTTLEVLSEANNVYRSLLAAVVCVFLLRVVQAVELRYPSIASFNSWILLLGILLILLFSYKKQVGYVRKRVEVIMEQNQ